MNGTELMKIMDLSGELGLVLRMNPVWKKECVIYGGNLDDPYIMCFSLGNGRWKIVTDAYEVLNLPQEAIEMMGEISKLWEEKESRHEE